MNTTLFSRLFNSQFSFLACGSLLWPIALLAQAAPGDLDPTFGTNGQTILALGSAIHTPTGIAAQADGKYFVSYNAERGDASGGGIARFNADHTPDLSWGYNGVVGVSNSYAGFRQSNTVSGLTLSNGQVLSIENGGLGDGGNGNGQYPLTFVSRYTADGKLDRTFGGFPGGQTYPFPAGGIDFSQRYNAIAIAPDGKIVVAGESSGSVLVIRFSANGILDTSFGVGGWTRLTIRSPGDVGLGVAVQPDGKIVVVGNNSVTLSGFVARLGDTGTLDASFNGGGTYLLPIAAGVTDCRSVLLDGTRIVVGCTQTSGTVKDFLLLGLTTTGVVDTGFDSTLKDAGGANDALYGIFKHPDGRIFAAGRGGAGSNRIALLAVNANGTLASGFASNGLYIAPETEASEARAVGWNGTEIIIAGSRTVSSRNDAVLTTITPAGLRTSQTYTSLAFSDGRYRRVKALPDGRILAAGNTILNGISNFLISRLNVNGALDTAFGTAGHATLSTVDYEFFGLQDFALQADGKMVLTGDSGRGNTTNQSVGAARMLADGGIDVSFNAVGTPGQNYLGFPNTPALDETSLNYNPALGRAIRVQADGKILAASRLLITDYPRSQSIIVRFNADGTVDNSYGTNGVAKTSFVYGGLSRAIDIDAVGRAVLVGVGLGGVQLTRFDTNGILDPTFGTGGLATYALPAGFSTVNAPTKAIVLPTGKILAVLNAGRAGDGVVGVMRVDANGGLDSAFGDGGFSFVVTAPGTPDGAFVNDAAIMPNGHIVLASSSRKIIQFENVFTPALVRFLPNGMSDNNFGTGAVRYYAGFDQLAGIDAMNDGSLLLSGFTVFGGQYFGIVAKTVAETFAGLNLLAVKSGKMHGVAGTFHLPIDILQSLGDLVSVEPRTIGTAHTLVFQFDGPVNSVGDAKTEDAQAVTVGTTSAALSGSDVVVTLSGALDSKRVRVTLTGLNGSGTASASVGFLVGDVNNSRAVNSSDISAVKARSGQTVDATNFKFDLNASGGINSSDISAVKARSGLSLP